MSAVIEAHRVSKQFRLSREGARSFKDRFVHLGRGGYEEFWALRDIDFTVSEGETLGVLGHNGSGKSTLLKCIAGILVPTEGEIRTRGLVAALLELGAGFHPELTGRENVFINAALLGLSKRETAKRLDEIVAYSELEDFIDQQVKHYSSGMYVRLGFAVAINVEPRILLIDEVLAVGDEAFSRKCTATINQFQEEGRTIVFVTHAVDLAREICSRVIVLDHGEMIANDEPGMAIRSYRDHLYATGRGQEMPLAVSSDDPGAEARAPVSPSGAPLRIRDVRIEFPAGQGRDYLLAGEPLDVDVDYEAREPSRVVFGLAIRNERGEHIWGSNSHLEGLDLGTFRGRGTVRFSFSSVALLDGGYRLEIGVTDQDGEVVDWIDNHPGFRVVQRSRAVGIVALPVRIEHLPNGAHGIARSRSGIIIGETTT